MLFAERFPPDLQGLPEWRLRFGVLAGSLMSGLSGYLLLKHALRGHGESTKPTLHEPRPA